MITRLRPLAAIFLLAAAGCASGPGSARDKLALASRDYHDALQYGDFPVIARYLAPEKRTDFLARAYGVEKTLSVLEFAIVSVDVAEDGEKARMLTRLSWYELPSTSVKTENVFIDWKRQDAGGEAAWAIEAIEGGPLPVAAATAAE